MLSARKINMATQIITFGCRLNFHETEVIRKQSAAAGLETLEDGAIIINSCAVTGEAVRQAKQAVRKARRDNPKARIIVTGCAAQSRAGDFAEMEEVDLILGNEEKLHAHSYRQLPEFGVNQFEKLRVNDIMEVRENAPHMVDLVEARARAFHVADSTLLCSMTANLGDVKTTITHPASTSHGRLSEEQRQAAGIGQGLLRISVGLEHLDDLKADLLRGLDTLA